MKKYFFSVEDNKRIESDGAFSADERSRPQSTLGQKDTVSIQFVNNKTLVDSELVNYTEFLAGTTARFLVDVDYLNAGVLIPLGNTGWSLSSGAEYKKILSTKPDTVKFDGVDSSEGTVGSLVAGEWGYIDLSSEIVVRLSDDADPSIKDEDFVQVLYINASATPLFIEASSDVFNLPNSWLDEDGVTLRNPDITDGEATFFIDSNTVNFYNRLGGSAKSDGFAEIQLFEPSTALFFMKAKFSYTCTNRLLTSGEDPLELVGVDVYTKAESDAKYLSKIVSPVVDNLVVQTAGGLADAGKPASSVPTTDEAAAIQGANSPNGSNVFATIADATNPLFSTYPSKTTPVNADTFITNDSADTFTPKEVSWQNIRNTLSTLYQNIDFNDFDIENIAAIGFKDGEAMTWNAGDFCVDIPTGLGPVLQTGQELYVIIYNGTGSQIDNGSPVYPVGAFGTRPSMAPANSTTHVKITGAVLLTTMDIPNGQFGIASSFGRVRGINTTAIGSSGNTVWVKAGAIDGLLTVDKPAFPNYVIQIGGIAVEDAVDGVIQIDIKGTPEDTITNFFNGTFRETFDFTVSESGGVITGSLSPANGHDDMTMNFSDGFTMLTTTPAATIILTAGTDENPQTNFVYILQSAKVLALSTAGWPTAEHIKVAKLEIQSAAQTQTDGGALRNQNINDAIENTDTNQGHLTHITSAIREKVPAKILSGIEGTCTTDGTDVFIAVTAGIVKQMHNQSIPAIDTAVSDFVKIKNNFASPLVPVQNLNGQTLDSQGNTLDNTSFSFVLWEIGNKSGEPSFGMINLPSDSYAFNSPDSAVNDALNYADYSIPDIYFGVAVLVARFTYTYKAGAWVLYATESLRGQVPNTSAGGGGGGGAGVSTWLALLDTPSSFAGQAGLIPIVNVGESALEFGAVGSGDVVGPVSSTDNAIVRYDSTTGKLIQNSLITITDAGKLSFPDIATTGIMNMIARSVAPTTPATNDVYLDDGSNSSSGGLAWRKYNGATWDDVGVGSGVSDTFVYGDLTAGVLSVTHSFGLWYPSAIAMWNTTTGELYSPPADTITTTNNNIDIDMSSFGVFANTFLYNFGSATSNGSPITNNFTNYGNYYSANSLPLDYDETLWSVSTRPIIDYDIIGAPLMRFDYATAEYAGAFVLDEIPADSTNLATRVKVRPFSTGATGTNMGWTIKYIVVRDNVATTSIATQILGSTVFETSGAGDTTDTYEIALSTLSAQAGDTIVCILYPDTTVATPKQTDWMLLNVNMGVS